MTTIHDGESLGGVFGDPEPVISFGMARRIHSRLPANPPKPKTEGIATEAEVVRYIDLKLAALGHPTSRHTDSDFLEIARPLLRNYHQKDLMLGNLLCPADRRIQTFLDDLFERCVSAAARRRFPATRFCWTGRGSRA